MAPTKSVAIKSPRKLIEVALPLDKINAAAAREKSIRHGHPSTLHLWWARRPLAAARAVLFAQLVNDPGFERHLNRGVNKVEAAKERERLFKIIEDLVMWENTDNEQVLSAARAEIRNSWRETCDLNRNHPDAEALFDAERLPAFHDPFAGGGAIPLEAQRLGLTSFASDLNPVAVTINKAMIEIPPRFASYAPIGPIPIGEREASLARTDWPGTSGLAEDVRRYGAWMRCEAEKQIGHLYPTIEVTAQMAVDQPDLKPTVGKSLTVIAWLWARTVKSPNPAYSHVDVPLVSSFILSKKPGKEVYVEPIIDGDKYTFVVKAGKPPASAENGTKISQGSFRCILSDTAMRYEYIDAEANAGRISSRLMAIVVEGDRSRVYLPPSLEPQLLVKPEEVAWRPETPCRGTFASNAQGRIYGFKVFGDYFTNRQLVALNCFSDLVSAAIAKCNEDGLAAGLSKDNLSFDEGGSGSFAYAQAVGTYLSLSISKSADYNSSLCGWINNGETIRNTFGRQAISMSWDFAESNILGSSTGSHHSVISQMVRAIPLFPGLAGGRSDQQDAQTVPVEREIISTDPPYFDNIGYADLSDFFYVWLRRSARSIFPKLFGSIAVPKAEELVATPFRHGGKEGANAFFLQGMTTAMENLAEHSHPAFPITIYYAFKQGDNDGEDDTSNSGWDTFLTAILKSGLSIGGTWPMRTERGARTVGLGSNALASSIILVCRRRDADAVTISRRDFLRELHRVLPDSLVDMTRGGVNSPVAPVDLSQAIIGPGMGIFSKYEAVLEADGSPMTVKTALQLINRFLADDEFDSETQFCLQWLESYGWKAADYGLADTLAQAKGSGLSQMHREGLLTSGGGLVQLIRWQELDTSWIPGRHNLTPVWQALHQLIANLQIHGEQSAGTLLAAMPAVSGRVRTLSYRLYTLAERKGLAEDARPYNELIGSWAAIELAAAEVGPIDTQAELF